MTNQFDFRRTAIAAFAALLVSTACIVGTVGPIQTGPAASQAQLAGASQPALVRIA